MRKRHNKPDPNILDTIGNTPLVRLEHMITDSRAEVFAKLEFLNPLGSVKDRTVKYMLEQAEAQGLLQPGMTIIENSSGNTAMALAGICALKGYHCKIIIRDNLSVEKIKFLQALAVDLVFADHTLPPESPDSYNNLAPRIAAETPFSYYLDQHNNRSNNAAHYHTTGPEIWEQMEGKIDFFIAGMGTGGTICGAARFLKEQDPAIQVIGVDPAGSIFYDYFHSGKLVPAKPYLLEGLGDEFLIGCVDFSLIDDVMRVSDKQAFLTTRRLAREETILAGGSSGAALWAVLQKIRGMDKTVRVVTIFPDSANRYLSSIYNDDWLKAQGVL